MSVYGEGDVDPVVNEESGVIAAAEQVALLGEREQLFTAEIFFPQLNCFDAAVQRLL